MLLVYFVAIINQPYVGLELTNFNGQWTVTGSDPYGEGFKSGIQIGDVIVKINNVDTGKYPIVQKWNEAEGASTIETQKMGQPLDYIIDIPKRTKISTVLSEITMVILGFIFWFMGFLTWFKRPFLVQARALFWLNWFIGLAIALAPASSRVLLYARELEYITLSFVPILLIYFVSVFPSETKRRINKLGHYTVTIMFLIIVSLMFLQFAAINYPNLLRKLVLSTLTVGILLALWNIGKLIHLPNDKPEKNQANILFWGMTVGLLPFTLLTAVPLIFGFQPVVDSQISYLFVSAIPITWHYVIVHRYLPDSSRILEKIIAFFFAGIITSLVVICVLFLIKEIKNLNIQVYLASLSLTMLFILCFNLIRVAVSKLLLNYVFPEERVDLKKRILKLSETLSSINEEDQILESYMKSLKIEGLFIIIEDGKGEYLKKSVGRFLNNPVEQAILEKSLQKVQRKNLNIKILPDDSPAEIYIPFEANDFSCHIFLGHRYSYLRFEQDDLPFMMLISGQLAQRLITTLTIKEMSKEIKDLVQRTLDSQRRNQGLRGITASLFKNLEKEKKLIALDIHDGPLQLGLDLNRWLKYLVEECLTSDDFKTTKAISHMREVVEDLNFELRLICNDLRPPSLTDLGMLPAIELMCEEIMQRELLIISIETEGISHEERFQEDVELVAYRFVQEGITNVVKHSGSNKLKIHIEKNESKIELSVSDAGIGFDTSKIEDWSVTGAHFGLVGMKERLESLGGELQIHSIIGQGTELIATILII